MTKRKPNLRSVRELTPSLQFRTIHGYRRAFRVAGSGPAILLIHGIGDNSTTWSTVQTKLAQRFTVIAPDLLGHGKSDKPRADYSVAAYANGMRDLLSVLDIDHVTVIGHSLGGGVAMQFAYQFPQLVDRLILVGAGGVTKDVNVALRYRFAADGQRGAGAAPPAAGAARDAGGGPRCRRRCWGPPALAATCPTCCASWPICPSRPPPRHLPAHCAPSSTGEARSSPCSTGVI